MKKILFAATVFVLGFTHANAQYDSRYDRNDRRDYDYPGYSNGRDARNGDPEINHLQREARQRIEMGTRRRAISPREADALMHEYRRIEAMERKFSRRGRLSNRESRIIQNDLERLMTDTRRMSNRRGDNWARERGRY